MKKYYAVRKRALGCRVRKSYNKIKKCYMTLEKIRQILEAQTDDESCFEKIEKVMAAYNKIGIFIKNRHDFG